MRPLLRSRARRVRPYAVALAAVAVAIAIRVLASPWLESRLPDGPLYAAVALAAWHGGWRPGALAAAAGFVASEIFLHGVGSATPLALLLYAGSCAAIVYFLDGDRRALADAARLAQALRAKMREQDVMAAHWRAAEARFRDSHDASLQGYAIFSPLRERCGAVADFGIEYINPAAAAALGGGAAGALLGRRLSDLHPACGPLAERLARVLVSGEAGDFELEYASAAGVTRLRHLAAKSGDALAVAFVDVTGSRPQPDARSRATVTLLR